MAGSPILVIAVVVMMIAINVAARKLREERDALVTERDQLQRYLVETGQLGTFALWRDGGDLRGYRWRRVSPREEGAA